MTVVGSAMAAAARVVPDIAATAANAAPEAVNAAKAATQVPPTGWGPTGVVSVAAGLSTFGLGLYSSFRDVFSEQRQFNPSLVLGPMTSLAAGASLLLIAQNGKWGAGPAGNIVRGAALTLMGSGTLAALSGATGLFNTYKPKPGSGFSGDRITTEFTRQPVGAVSELEGNAVARSRGWTTNGDVAYNDVYLDPTTAKRLAAGLTPADGLRHAQAAAQADDQDRSFALVQTRDGTLWIARLTGDMDQVDGRNYAKDNTLDKKFMDRLELEGKHPSVLGLAGVQRFAVFPPREVPTLRESESPPVVPVLPTPGATPPAPAGAASSATAPTPATPTPGATR